MKTFVISIGMAILVICLGIFALATFSRFQHEMDWTAFSIIFICGVGLIVIGFALKKEES